MTAATQPQPLGLLARRFGLAERGTNPRTEALGGVATFLTMSYIVFVNPAILSAAGVPLDAVIVGTALAAAVTTAAMALATNLPFALAPGLGINAIGYVVIMATLGRAREIHPLMWGIAPFFVLFFAADWLEANVF